MFYQHIIAFICLVSNLYYSYTVIQSFLQPNIISQYGYRRPTKDTVSLSVHWTVIVIGLIPCLWTQWWKSPCLENAWVGGVLSSNVCLEFWLCLTGEEDVCGRHPSAFTAWIQNENGVFCQRISYRKQLTGSIQAIYSSHLISGTSVFSRRF